MPKVMLKIGGVSVEEKERATAFSEEEEVALATAVKDREHVLFGKFDSGAEVSRTTKKKMWIQITSEVNAVGGRNRTIDQIKTKHKNLKAATKTKAAKISRTVNKTGVGESDVEDLNEAEKILVQTIPEECISGIEGGIDVHGRSQSATSTILTASNIPKLGLVQPDSPVGPASIIPLRDDVVAVSDASMSTTQKAFQRPQTKLNGNVNKNIEDREEIPNLSSPSSSKRPFRKAEKSRVEKLMEEQINVSTNLVTATENLVTEIKVSNQFKQQANELLLRLVAVKEEEISYKRMKHSTGDA